MEYGPGDDGHFAGNPQEQAPPSIHRPKAWTTLRSPLLKGHNWRTMGLWCTIYVLVWIELTVRRGHRPMGTRWGTPSGSFAYAISAGRATICQIRKDLAYRAHHHN